jgi:hypothetical protein
MSGIKTEIGQKYGKLTLIEILDKFTKSKKRLGRFSCDCGGEITTAIEYVRYEGAGGGTKSCGCMKKESCRKNIILANKVLLETGVTKTPRVATAIRVYKTYADEDLTFDDFMKLTQENCFYCGKEPSNKANCYFNGKKYNYGYLPERVYAAYFIYNGLDRQDNSKGHFRDNVVPCCWQCNKGKMEMNSDEFLAWVERIYNYSFNNKNS